MESDSSSSQSNRSNNEMLLTKTLKTKRKRENKESKTKSMSKRTRTYDLESKKGKSKEPFLEETTDSETENENEESTDEFAAIKEELSTLSFEELKKLKEKIGLKVFNQVLHGDRRGSESKKKVFKRANKNRPMEISSKKPVPRLKRTAPAKKKVTRDPRFDDLSGEYREELFSRSYGFLDDIKSREREKVQKSLKKEKDPEKKQELQYLLNRMKQQEQASDKKDQQKRIERDWKKKEQVRVKEGKTPFYLKKSERRKLELAEKYRELQKSGKVDAYLGKKRKKTAQKEKKKLPVQVVK
uniref:rRNA biogenesis protein RRP36 n=1 Tax=Crassostrea virginica TaxID=6565 RepID=A0A8B8E3Y8_CRAVI|nr:ribosomal RNA processing protein 36 homolog isoform X1 [Crassostrea virginica]XP_022334423.1 ribosomal RNA processing protein 36 homolog isoform X1 [Crassostrea virginica]XP_022334424.1 ribosomal RNA processing protein 36 homolog isoform X2 [Crassostrea virginica]